MFAVVKTGGKQYRIAESDRITVERIIGDVGSEVRIDEVLAVGVGGSVSVGTPTVPGAVVTAELISHKRGPKVLVFKKRRRQNSRRLRGHRQDLTVLKIKRIEAGE